MNKKIVLLILSVFAVVIACAAQEEIKPAQEFSLEADPGTCVTDQCHPSIDKQKFVHKPILENKCKDCHGESPRHWENPGVYKFTTITDVSGVCFECHKRFPDKEFTHYPIQLGQCTDCHSPHGSQYKFQLLAKGSDLCFQCHDKSLVDGNFIHGPAAVGGCIACHEPHTADYARILKTEGPDLCFMCHTDKAQTINNTEFLHKPVSESCTKCHDPHSAPIRFMLEITAPVLCYSCHTDKKKQISNVSVKHRAVEIEKSCLNCHDPHNSNIARILTMESMDLCLTCHDREYKLPDGKVLMDMKELLVEHTDHHGPIRQKDCSGCHNAHGDEFFRILRKPYPPKFYMPFSVENYALCFGCHEKTIVLDPETTKLTNFRNGRENLHFKHVNKPDKGRTCRACHETHASNFPKHIREAVPFGVWELPVNYEKTKTGGSCTPGCHKLKKYDRTKRVINP